MQKMLEQKAGSLDAVLIDNGSLWSGEVLVNPLSN